LTERILERVPPFRHFAALESWVGTAIPVRV